MSIFSSVKVTLRLSNGVYRRERFVMVSLRNDVSIFLSCVNGRIAVVSAVLPEESVSVEEKRKKENNE